MNSLDLWKRYQDYYCVIPSVGFSLDISRMKFSEKFLKQMEPRIQKAFDDMTALEKGAISNPDENRMVGHYWLRSPELAPTADIGNEIRKSIIRIKQFASDIHAGKIISECRKKFTDLLIIGIGGSALGPQFVSYALGHSKTDKLHVSFFDNTDPDGMDQVIASLSARLATTLTVVISKSGGTQETRNGCLEAQHAYKKAGIHFANHAVAITGVKSELDLLAEREKWLDRFPMWDWVGGRTSELSAVGLLPAALQGVNIDAMLEGAHEMDRATRSTQTQKNPSALLALMWFYAVDGRGAKDMVVLPYKDRLLLLSRYLQQLVMESLGKERDLRGKIVHQGIAVYGNKGSTDQHAYMQQLRDGTPNFFATFIEVLKDRDGVSFFINPGITSGDYLHGFLQGTRQALYEKDRESITLTLPDVSSKTVGALIALYERAVGFYGSLIEINPYHQPGVEAGKKAANDIIAIQQKVIEMLTQHKGQKMTADQVGKALGIADQTEMIFQILCHLAANPDRGINSEGILPSETMFWIKSVFGK